MESTAYIQYSADVEGIKFDLLKIELVGFQIESLTLTMTGEKKINLNFVVLNPISLNEACQLTKEVAERVLDIFSYFYNIRIGKLYLDDDRLESVDENGNKRTTISMRDGIRIGGTISCITLVNKLDNSLVDLINTSSSNRKLFLSRQFRFSIQNEDPISRYMFLYSLLLQTCNDKQGEVDTFICAQEPTVELFQSPKSPKTMETVYTKLRNEIAHVRKNVTLEGTAKEIKLRVNNLQSLTRCAIDLLA